MNSRNYFRLLSKMGNLAPSIPARPCSVFLPWWASPVPALCFPEQVSARNAGSNSCKDLFWHYGSGEVNVTPDNIRRGRPSRWSLATARKICNWVKKGIPLRYASPLVGVPWDTAKEWVGKYPEFAPMLEEAHSFFVTSHVQNIERHSKMSEKPSQWLLERRAKDEFSPAYTQSPTQQSLNVVALGNDALAKLMQGWGGMLGGQTAEQSQPTPIPVESQQIPDTQPTPTLLTEHITESSEASAVKLEARGNKIEASNIEEVKPKRGRGRPRKYPKPDTTPATPPPAPHL